MRLCSTNNKGFSGIYYHGKAEGENSNRVQDEPKINEAEQPNSGESVAQPARTSGGGRRGCLPLLPLLLT